MSLRVHDSVKRCVGCQGINVYNVSCALFCTARSLGSGMPVCTSFETGVLMTISCWLLPGITMAAAAATPASGRLPLPHPHDHSSLRPGTCRSSQCGESIRTAGHSGGECSSVCGGACCTPGECHCVSGGIAGLDIDRSTRCRYLQLPKPCLALSNNSFPWRPSRCAEYKWSPYQNINGCSLRILLRP